MDKSEERSMPLIGVYLYNRELTTEITFGFAVWRRGRQQYISSVALPACINVDIGSSFRPFPNRRHHGIDTGWNEHLQYQRPFPANTH